MLKYFNIWLLFGPPQADGFVGQPYYKAWLYACKNTITSPL